MFDNSVTQVVGNDYPELALNPAIKTDANLYHRYRDL